MVTAKSNEGLNLQRYVEIGLRRWWLIAASPLVAAILVFVWNRSQSPIYEASVTLLLQQNGGGSSSANPTLGDFQASERLASTYRELITTKPVLEDLAVELNLSAAPVQLRGKVTATVIRDTRLLRVSVRDGDPKLAADMASTLAEVFIRRQQEDQLTAIARLQAAAAARGIVNQDSLLDAQLATIGSVSVVDPPSVPTSPVLPKTKTNVLIAIILGLLFGALLAFILEYFNDKLRTPEEFDELLEAFKVTHLGTVPRWRSADMGAHQLSVVGGAASQVSRGEPYRQLRTNIQFALAPHPGAKIILISSPLPGEGKSTTAVNLGLALAQSGARVVLLDADLRRPDLHRWFDGVRDFGLSNALADPSVTVDQIIRQSPYDNVQIIVSGPLPPNPAEMLSLPKIREVLATLKQRFDFVIVDSPPILPVADTVELMKSTDGLLLVVRADATGRRALRECLRMTQKTGIPILGAVINAHRPSRIGYGYGYNYYRYGYGYGYGAETNNHNGLLSDLKKNIGRILTGRPRRRSGSSRQGSGATPPA
ncbi:MAG: polysaccharide biosynthesis tyrosine autokinase [Dehalococcoidia bacterium]|nr:polysaccharide biosynthesis tyrosine autokinase [Dehalococcoidia bacterium]